jgi:uncharacterized membrane protein YqjE
MQNEVRQFSDLINQLKYDAKDFVATRVQMLRAEMKDKLTAWKVAVLMLAGAALCGVLAFVLLNFSILSFLAGWFAPDVYRWCYAGLILFGFYAILGAALYGVGRRQLRSEPFAPERTLRILKQDQIWIQSEARPRT